MKTKVHLANGSTTPAAYLTDEDDIYQPLAELGFQKPCKVLVLVGGAHAMSSEDMETARPFFQNFLVPFIERHKAAVLDGGSNSGVMRLMGESRAAVNAKFPLIGVLPASVVQDVNVAEPNHSHFLLVPGVYWGDECSWIARFATALSRGEPSLTVLVNGGEVSFQDVQCSISERRKVYAIEGTGRIADDLAAVARGEKDLTSARPLAASGLIIPFAIDKEGCPRTSIDVLAFD